MRSAALAYFEAHSYAEGEISGTLRAALIDQASARMKRGFLDALGNFESGRLPSFRAEQFRRLDADLNATYGKVVKADFSGSTFQTSEIRKAQRAWLTYRDAWVRFGAIKYPTVPAHAWRANFTRNREAILRELLSYQTPAQ